MDENILKFRVGIFVVIALCILGILIFVNAEGWGPQYTVYVKPQSAPGVTKGTPVRKNGILIGRVKEVTSQQKGVLLELAINENETLYEHEICSIGAESILGDAVVEFLIPPDEQFGNPIGNEHMVNRVDVKTNPMELVADLTPQLSQTLATVQESAKSIEAAGVGVRELTDSVQDIFDNEDSEVYAMIKSIRELSDHAELSLNRVDRVFTSLQNIVGDPEFKQKFDLAMDEVPKIFKSVQETVEKARDAIDGFGTIPERVNENMDNLAVVTESLKTDGPKALENLNSSLENIDEFVSEIRAFTKSLKNLEQSEGTIGKLLNDTELYDSALDTMNRVRKMSIKLEPMLNDVRMFADEIARDPGVLGVRGALDRRPSKSGYKGNPVGRDGGLYR